MTPHRAYYHKPLYQIPAHRAPLVVTLGVLAWLLVALLGHGFWLLLMALERVA